MIVRAAAAAKSLQSCPTLCDPVDGSPPGSPIPGILQARTLEWVAISFSNAWKWKVKGKSLSRVRLFATPWTAAYQTPLSMGFSRQEYWSGVPSPWHGFYWKDIFSKLFKGIHDKKVWRPWSSSIHASALATLSHRCIVSFWKHSPGHWLPACLLQLGAQRCLSVVSVRGTSRGNLWGAHSWGEQLDSKTVNGGLTARRKWGRAVQAKGTAMSQQREAKDMKRYRLWPGRNWGVWGGVMGDAAGTGRDSQGHGFHSPR